MLPKWVQRIPRTLPCRLESFFGLELSMQELRLMVPTYLANMPDDEGEQVVAREHNAPPGRTESS